MPVELDIEVPRNGNYFKGWTLTDDKDIPLDITGWTLKLNIRAAAGSGPVLSSAIISSRDDGNGFFNVRIAGSSLSGVQGVMEKVYLAYDLIAYDTDNIVIVETRGRVILMPGVTFQ